MQIQIFYGIKYMDFEPLHEAYNIENNNITFIEAKTSTLCETDGLTATGHLQNDYTMMEK